MSSRCVAVLRAVMLCATVLGLICGCACAIARRPINELLGLTYTMDTQDVILGFGGWGLDVFICAILAGSGFLSWIVLRQWRSNSASRPPMEGYCQMLWTGRGGHAATSLMPFTKRTP